MMNQDYDKRGLWSIGKTEYKRFMNIKFKKSTSTKAFLWGILFTAIPVLPLAWTLFEVIEVYWYNPNTVYLFFGLYLCSVMVYLIIFQLRCLKYMNLI